MISRRTALLTPLAVLAASKLEAASKMTLGLHQNTSVGAGYKASLEGWAKAGIKHVELNQLVDAFLKTETVAAAKRVLSDNGLTPVSAASGAGGIFEPNPKRAEALDGLKKRCELFAELGVPRIYQPTGTPNAKFTADDYKAAAANMHEVGEIASQYKLTFGVEALRNSAFISTVSTLVMVTRQAAHPNLKPLLDLYHFWSGMSKFEDLDLFKPGEIGHVHFQDVPDLPRELLDSSTRAIPGDGVSPLDRILRKIADKGYAGTLSVELFLPKYQQGDPYEVASEIRRKAEAVMRKANVL